MTDQKYKLVLLPERSMWNQVTGRDGKNFTDGWNACLDAIAAAPVPMCKWTRKELEEYLHTECGSCFPVGYFILIARTAARKWRWWKMNNPFAFPTEGPQPGAI